jgi:hypothetical protein
MSFYAASLSQVAELIDQDPLFWFSAVLGTGMFAGQLVLNLVGGWGFEEMHEGSDTGKFKWLSRQATTGFLMLFGWTALSCRREFGFETMASAGMGLLGGAVAVLATGLMFKMAKKLQSRGTMFQIDDAVGKEAVVYQEISQTQAGKISISLDQFVHEIDALSLIDELIPSFTRVQVVKKMDEKTVFVIPINKEVF